MRAQKSGLGARQNFYEFLSCHIYEGGCGHVSKQEEVTNSEFGNDDINVNLCIGHTNTNPFVLSALLSPKDFFSFLITNFAG